MEIKTIMKIVKECADKTDIWDNERWDPFLKVLRKALKKEENSNNVEDIVWVSEKEFIKASPIKEKLK